MHLSVKHDANKLMLTISGLQSLKLNHPLQVYLKSLNLGIYDNLLKLLLLFEVMVCSPVYYAGNSIQDKQTF